MNINNNFNLLKKLSFWRVLLVISLFSFLFISGPKFLNADSKSPLFLTQNPNQKLVYPLVYDRVSGKFGKRKHPIYKRVRHHSGIDLAAPKGAHVRAVTKGKVIYADTYGGFGKLVTIYHGSGFTSLYGHLSELLVSIGEEVDAGEVIGKVGSTGNSTGPHLHFEWREEGKAVDPLTILPGLTSSAEG